MQAPIPSTLLRITNAAYEELDSIFHEHYWTGDDLMDADIHDDFVKADRAILARRGQPTTPETTDEQP